MILMDIPLSRAIPSYRLINQVKIRSMWPALETLRDVHYVLLPEPYQLFTLLRHVVSASLGLRYRLTLFDELLD